EWEAHRIAMEWAAKAGYSPHAAVTLWEKIAKVGGGNPESRNDFLSTHPAPVKRMETLAGLVPQMMPFYQAQSPRPSYQLRAQKAGPADLMANAVLAR